MFLKQVKHNNKDKRHTETQSKQKKRKTRQRETEKGQRTKGDVTNIMNEARQTHTKQKTGNITISF